MITPNDILNNIKKLLGHAFIRNVLTVGLVTLGIRGIGFYKELIIAENYGLSILLDTFLIAILVPGFISTVFISSYNNVFIPNYVLELKVNGNIKAFQTTSFLITFSIGVFFTVTAYLLTDVFLENLYPNHSIEYYSLIKIQLYYILPCIVIWSISSVLTGLLNIDGEYLYSSIGSLFMSISTIICVWLFKDVLGERTLAFGILIGVLSILCFYFLYLLKEG